MHNSRPAFAAALTALAMACAVDAGDSQTETPPVQSAAGEPTAAPAVDAEAAPEVAQAPLSDLVAIADSPEPEEHVAEEDVADQDEARPTTASPGHSKLPAPKSVRKMGIASGGRGMHKKGKRKRRPSGPMAIARQERPSTENYAHISDNAFVATADDARSTFSIDVDTAAYSNMRRFVTSGSMPPKDSVRVEELINYFSYDYKGPGGADPFSMISEVAACPWNDTHRLVHVGLQGKIIDQQDVPARNLVFLFDVSGSMNNADKLPLLQKAFALLVDNLRPEDTVSIVVYAGASGVVLKPTSGKNKQAIMDALRQLRAGGSTNGGEGIHLAYKLANKSFVKGGINRVILATDGDFNVGTTSQGELVRLIEEKRRGGVFLSVLGFGSGNLKDSTMESLADKGNGNYAYIDSINEARKVLVEQAGATLVTIAKDVKIQVEFNPAEVASYRLIGYENRKLAHTDFNDDTKDAGEIGAGHSVTALYEVVPAGTPSTAAKVDPSKYTTTGSLSAAAKSGELMTVKVRYKQPDGRKSKLLSFAISDADASLEETSRDFRFSAAVAGFGMLLRDSTHKGDATYASVKQLAREAVGKDPHGHRREFLTLVDKAAKLAK